MQNAADVSVQRQMIASSVVQHKDIRDIVFACQQDIQLARRIRGERA